MTSSTTYTYDDNDNLTSQVTTVVTSVATTDSTNRFDAAGNPLVEVRADGSITTNTYDTGNRLMNRSAYDGLSATTLTTLAYDGDGNRTSAVATVGSTVTTTTYGWDDDRRFSALALPSGTTYSFTAFEDASIVAGAAIKGLTSLLHYLDENTAKK